MKGIEDLPTDYFTAGVVTASIKKESVDPNNIICEGCENVQATEYCKDCMMNYCTDCKKVHLKPRVTAHHQFIPLEQALGERSNLSAPRITHCKVHHHQEVTSYCKTDQIAVCPQCAVDSHRGHDVDLLSSTSQGFKDTISTLMNKVCSALWSSSFLIFNLKLKFNLIFNLILIF